MALPGKKSTASWTKLLTTRNTRSGKRCANAGRECESVTNRDRDANNSGSGFFHLVERAESREYEIVRKQMSRGEAETKRRKAADFLRRVGRDDDADRFEAMDADEYAAHKGAQLLPNPNWRQTMARQMNPTAGELSETLAEIADLAEEALDPELTREEVVAKIKELADVAAGESEEDEDEHEETDQDDLDGEE
jgi:hypothetical protein